jgi:hypothetical protein
VQQRDFAKPIASLKQLHRAAPARRFQFPLEQDVEPVARLALADDLLAFRGGDQLTLRSERAPVDRREQWHTLERLFQ